MILYLDTPTPSPKSPNIAFELRQQHKPHNENKHKRPNVTTPIGIQIPNRRSSSHSTLPHLLSYTVTFDESYEEIHRYHTTSSPITTTQPPSSPCLIQQRHQPQGTDTNPYKTVETYQQRSTKYTLFLFLSPKH